MFGSPRKPFKMLVEGFILIPNEERRWKIVVIHMKNYLMQSINLTSHLDERSKMAKMAL